MIYNKQTFFHGWISSSRRPPSADQPQAFMTRKDPRSCEHIYILEASKRLSILKTNGWRSRKTARATPEVTIHSDHQKPRQQKKDCPRQTKKKKLWIYRTEQIARLTHNSLVCSTLSEQKLFTSAAIYGCSGLTAAPQNVLY